VRNLLVFTGSRQLALRRLKLDRVISRALASRRASLARNGIEVVRNQPGSLPVISGDSLLLQEVFVNVLINAEHAIVDRGNPGSIEITTRVDDEGKMLVTTIKDSGPGIPEDVLPRIFDPFFTTKDVGKGSGLGRAHVYGILEEHGGTISAENAPGGGALVTIAVPVC
jgi:two-component system NtrC family sensor kinase